MVYFTADTHFGDSKFILDSNIPNIKSIFDYNEFIIELWNSTVSDDDDVWHLGDFSTIDFIEVALRLNGKKHLILGNHDVGYGEAAHLWESYYLDRGFTSINTGVIKLSSISYELYLSHLPAMGDPYPDRETYDEYRPQLFMKPLLCGHVHEHWRVYGNQLNVGLPQWNWKLVTMSQIERILSEQI